MRPPETREGVSLVVRGLQTPSFCMKKAGQGTDLSVCALSGLLFL